MKISILFFSFYWFSFFNTLFAFLLLVRNVSQEIQILLQSGWWAMIKSLSFYEFFLKGVFVLIWRTIRPNMNNDVVGIFLNLGLSETDLLFLRQEKIAPLSSYLRVLLSSNLLSLSLLLLMQYLFSILLTAWVVQILMDLTVMRWS